MLRNALFVTLVLAVAVGCSSKKDDPVVTPPPFGPSLIAVGDDGNVLTSGDALNWALITVPAGMQALDLGKVVRVPNHANRRLVTFGFDTGQTLAPAEIWYSDDSGNNWTKAVITVSTVTGAHIAYWSLSDMIFVNALDGYAVGNDNVILRTVDAGANWTEMNMWNDGTTNTDVELDLSYSGTIPPVQGTVITQTQTSATVTGTVVSYDEDYDYVVVSGVTGGTFNTSDNVTWGTAETATVWSIDTTTWTYNFDNFNCIYAVENSGTGTSRAHTLWLANDEGDYYPGMWKIVSTAADPGAARTFTWTTPTVALQAESVVGDFNYDTVYRFFFFDENTGVAARQSYGILTTVDGGATWTHQATTEITSYNEYWSEFWYINNGATGWLYSIENDGYLARVGMDYSAAGTPPYTFSTTAVWEVLTTSGTNNSAEVDDHTGAVLYNNKVYAITVDSSGDWTYGSSIGNATFDNDVYSDPDDTYTGGVTTNGNNPMYDKEIKVTTTTYYLNHWCGR
jgi:hypothetical protein